MATRVLITGGQGLIGSRTRAECRHSCHQLLVLEESGVEPDLLVPGAARRILDRVSPDAVLHLAWVASSTSGYRQHPDNPAWVRATVELEQECLARGIWFIGTGTVAELEASPADLYTEAKSAVFRTLRPDIDAERISWLRPHYVFDPGLGRPEAMAEILRAIAAGEPPALRSPEAAHDFVHVRDVASAIDTVLSAGLRGLVPIGSGRQHTVAALAIAAGASGVTEATEPIATGAGPTADTGRLEQCGWSARWTKEYFDD